MNHSPVHTPIVVKDWKALFAPTKKTSSELIYHKPTKVNGKITVKPPPEIALKGIDIWKNCLVGQFIDKKPPFSFLRSTIERLWGRMEVPEIITTESSKFMFRFANFSALD